MLFVCLLFRILELLDLVITLQKVELAIGTISRINKLELLIFPTVVAIDLYKFLRIPELRDNPTILVNNRCYVLAAAKDPSAYTKEDSI